jgi:two-component system phosphate regulon sensor histidine kinase PhoR
MARGRLHRRFFLYYLAVIACVCAVAAWSSPSPAAIVRPLLAGAIAATALAAGLALLGAFRFGGDVESLTRAARDIALGRSVTAAELRARTSGATDEIGELAGALADLSRHHDEAIRTLRADEQRLRGVLDGMSEGVALLSGGRIAFANPAFARLLEIREPVEGRTPLEAARRSALADALELAGRGAAAEDRDVNLASGRVLQLRAAPLSDQSTVLLLLDVTEARSLERMRREFVANASHELRTPVAAIQAVAETLIGAPAMAGADRDRFERILLTHAERLGRLVKDLLDLSRAEAQPPAMRPIELSAPLESALNAVRDRADAKGLRLESRLPPELPPLLADSTAIEQVLVNLLENAIKYTPEGGRIQVRATIAEGGPRSMVALEVEDSGIGIPREHLPRIFERFYRADSSRTRDGGGTGLGLAIVKHLAQSHGGDVSVTSSVGVGTTFRVTFPLAA